MTTTIQIELEHISKKETSHARLERQANLIMELRVELIELKLKFHGTTVVAAVDEILKKYWAAS